MKLTMNLDTVVEKGATKIQKRNSTLLITTVLVEAVMVYLTTLVVCGFSSYQIWSYERL